MSINPGLSFNQNYRRGTCSFSSSLGSYFLLFVQPSAGFSCPLPPCRTPFFHMVEVTPSFISSIPPHPDTIPIRKKPVPPSTCSVPGSFFFLSPVAVDCCFALHFEAGSPFLSPGLREGEYSSPEGSFHCCSPLRRIVPHGRRRQLFGSFPTASTLSFAPRPPPFSRFPPDHPPFQLLQVIEKSLCRTFSFSERRALSFHPIPLVKAPFFF